MKYPITIMKMLLILWSTAVAAQNDPAGVEPAKAREIFDQMCAGCHGTEGNGQEGTKSGFVPRVGTLANKEYMAGVPDAYVEMIIKKGGAYMGKIATMPAWEKRLSEGEILGLVTHIRTFTK
jgi:mono/diheme cytochrome c family protein